MEPPAGRQQPSPDDASIASTTLSKPDRNRKARQSIILLLGVIAIFISLFVRNSTWAKERRLKTLNIEDLALANHDDPDDALTLVYYGDALIRANKAADAEKIFKHATEVAPKNEYAELGVASAQLRLNELPLAAESFQKAIKLDAHDKGAYLGLAQTLDRQGDSAQAAQQLKKLLELDPNIGTAWYYLGKMYTQTGDIPNAIDAMQHAVKVSSNMAPYWRDLGNLSHQISKLGDAQTQLRKSIQISASDPMAMLQLGQVSLELGDTPELLAEARKSFEAALQLDPTLQAAVFGMGQVFQRSADLPDAVKAYRRACLMQPSDEKAVRGLGNAELAIGNTADGKRLLAAADQMDAAKHEIDSLKAKLAADPRSRDIRLKLARMFRKYGNGTEALKQYALYEHLGAEDTTVRHEIEQYQAELDSRANAVQPNLQPQSQSAAGPSTDGKP